LEYLGISLNAWSIIIFLFSALNLISITFLFSKPLVRTIFGVVLLWFIVQILYSVYGYITGQIGFLLLGIFNILIGVMGAVLKFGQDEDEDEDQ
jgi:hypothetical protein